MSMQLKSLSRVQAKPVARAVPTRTAFAPVAIRSNLHNAFASPRAVHITRSDIKHVRPVLVVRAAAEGPAPEEEDFDLLGQKVADLTDALVPELRGCSIYLVGMMGSGKSTVGKLLANTMKYGFFDTDNMIELAHDNKPVSELFKEFGVEYFRLCEKQALQELSPYRNMVISTGGGAVINPQNWGSMRNGVVVWLDGDADLLARRACKDGPEKRPLLYTEDITSENALEKVTTKLSALLEERRIFYRNADVVVSIRGYGQDEDKGAPAAVVMYRLLKGIKANLDEKKREIEEKKNFTIENAADVSSMRTMQIKQSTDN